MESEIKIMVVAGEASGDLHAAKLVNALREKAGDRNISFFGCAGPRLREAGVEPIVTADSLSIVGLLEIGRALPTFWKAFQRLKTAAADRRPDVAILVDFPDFNLKLASSLKRSGLKVVYYISPQLWAWRKYRLRTIRKYVDLMIAILPFEKGWYNAHGVQHVEYVGSPLAMEVHADLDRVEFCKKHKLEPQLPIVSLLPGSRHKEITRIFPIMLASAALVAEKLPQTQFVTPMGSPAALKEASAIFEHLRSAGRAAPHEVIFTENETYNALNASDVAAVTSGTATLETGIIGTPMAIVYKTSTVNYKLLRPLISVEHFGLINLIAGERVAKELIQDDFTPLALCDELLRLLEPSANRETRVKLKAAADKLGHGGASKRAAEAIFKLIEG
ncbi:MAG TPA: lipid-A-disaccharide synthase [Pyrinomonadaceae bacterium]|nr:lipid-A-disaccharide synthase [Pyrinomonadaceae bacterium]